MIAAIVLALAFLLPALTPRPAVACPAECEAWLCLPGGFPPSECNAAKAAVLRRLARGQEPLPPWSSCRAPCGNAGAADLRWTQPPDDPRPYGGSVSAGLCRGIDANGCSYTYTPRDSGQVWVHVDGQRMDARYDAHSMPYTLAEAGAPQIDRSTCEDPPDPGGGTDPFDPPYVIGPPVPPPPPPAGGAPGAPCNTIACPHVQHGWGAAVDLRPIHWTLRAAPPVPQP